MHPRLVIPDKERLSTRDGQIVHGGPGLRKPDVRDTRLTRPTSRADAVADLEFAGQHPGVAGFAPDRVRSGWYFGTRTLPSRRVRQVSLLVVRNKSNSVDLEPSPKHVRLSRVASPGDEVEMDDLLHMKHAYLVAEHASCCRGGCGCERTLLYRPFNRVGD